MAIVMIPDENRTLKDAGEMTEYLASIGIDYERWEPSRPITAGASQEEILEAYGEEIERLKARGGYVTADVIDVNRQTPGLDAMLAKFNRDWGAYWAWREWLAASWPPGVPRPAELGEVILPPFAYRLKDRYEALLLTRSRKRKGSIRPVDVPSTLSRNPDRHTRRAPKPR